MKIESILIARNTLGDGQKAFLTACHERDYVIHVTAVDAFQFVLTAVRNEDS